MKIYRAIYLVGPLYALGDEDRKKPHYYVSRCTDFTEYKPGDVVSQEDLERLSNRPDVTAHVERWGG